jgi:hypothetical protein
MADEPSTPQEVWALIERADELVKYSGNRDQSAAFAQAREVLEHAKAAATKVPGAEKLEEQAQRRLDDLAQREAQGAQQ